MVRIQGQLRAMDTLLTLIHIDCLDYQTLHPMQRHLDIPKWGI